MRKSDLMLILRYLKRFLERPFFSRQKWFAFWRYVGGVYLLCYEKLRGLDYSMVYYTKDINSHSSVYTKVPKKVLKRIFRDIPDIKEKGFIDVGCGKGYAVMQAAKYGFKYVGGVEYTKELFNICKSNLTKQKISTKNIYNIDAKEFQGYKKFDVFFFNNPFDETIMEPVARKIFESHTDRVCYLYYLNPIDKERVKVIEKNGFNLIRQIPDKNEWYFNINVYCNRREEG